jgi:hypothetical protein
VCNLRDITPVGATLGAGTLLGPTLGVINLLILGIAGVRGGKQGGQVEYGDVPGIGFPFGTSPGSTSLNIEASWRRAWSWDVPMVLKGDTGAGCIRPCINYIAVIVAKSLEAVRGILKCSGNNSTVYTTLSVIMSHT